MANATHAPEAQGLAKPPGGATGWRRAEQLAPLTGIAVLVLGLAGLIVLEGPANRPELDAPRSVIALRTGTLPRWLAWLSLALALWLLIPPLGSSGGTQPENPAVWTGLAALPGVPIWTAVTAVVLMLKSRDR